MKLEKPIEISMTIDVQLCIRMNYWRYQKSSANLKGKNYQYQVFNGNMFDQYTDDKENRGYLKCTVGFDKDTNISLNDIEVFEQ